ncbi:interferon a3-like [Stegostoma tigrinum]|uniref:interferon a3-like n=1 Tax=Stegostoma tigrinum TaxID=3053191 RepID=UPI00287069BE|nr:interferon a3-like [Stegostoma tigrinum]
MGFSGVSGLCVLFVLLPRILSLDCQGLQLQKRLNKDALTILNAMAQERIQIVHQALRHISKIYSKNLGSVTWAREQVENFRLLLDRQLQELETCVRKPGAGSRQKRNSIILKYFRKLNKFLKQRRFSDCSWEIIRAETRARLQQLQFITGQLS